MSNDMAPHSVGLRLPATMSRAMRRMSRLAQRALARLEDRGKSDFSAAERLGVQTPHGGSA